MATLASAALKAAQLQIKGSELNDVKAVCHMLAEYQVEKSLMAKTPGVPINLNDAYYDAVEDASAKNLIIARDDRSEFSNMMNEFIKDTQFEKIKDKADKDLLTKIGAVKAKADGGHEFKTTAASDIATRTHKAAAQATTKELGVMRKEGSGLFKAFTTYDPNTKNTPAGERIETLNNSAFAKDREYRIDRIKEAKRYDALGYNATEEQKNFAAEINKRELADAVANQKKKHTYAGNPEDRMTAGQAAMYGIAKGTLSLGGSALMGAGSLGVKALMGAGSLAKAAFNNTRSNPNAAVPVPASAATSTATSAATAPATPATLATSAAPTVVPATGKGVSYVMSHNNVPAGTPAGTPADAEHADEEEDKNKASTIEFQEKQISLLKNIDDSIKKIDTGSDSGSGMFGGLLKGLTTLAPLLAAAASAATLLAPAIAAITAAATAFYLVVKLNDTVKELRNENGALAAKEKAGVLSERSLFKIGETGADIEGYQAYEKAKVDVAKTREQGWTEGDTAYAERIQKHGATDKAYILPQAADYVKSLSELRPETITRARASELSAANVAADQTKIEKQAAATAGAVSNVVNNRSVIMAPAATGPTQSAPTRPNDGVLMGSDALNGFLTGNTRSSGPF